MCKSPTPHSSHCSYSIQSTAFSPWISAVGSSLVPLLRPMPPTTSQQPKWPCICWLIQTPLWFPISHWVKSKSTEQPPRLSPVWPLLCPLALTSSATPRVLTLPWLASLSSSPVSPTSSSLHVISAWSTLPREESLMVSLVPVSCSSVPLAEKSSWSCFIWPWRAMFFLPDFSFML